MRLSIFSAVRGDRGSALVFALVLGIAASIAGIGTMRLVSGGSDLHKRDIEIIKSYWAGEGAMRIAMRYLSIATPLPAADISPFNPTGPNCCNGYTPATVIRCLGNRVFSCSTSVYSARTGFTNRIVCSKVAANNICRYTWFEKVPGTSPWESMIIYGDYHTNGHMMLSDFMTAEKHVTGKASTGAKFTANQFDRPNFPNPYRNGITIFNDYYSYAPPAGWLETRLPNYTYCGKIDPFEITPASFTSGVTTISTTGADSMAFDLNDCNVKVWKKTASGWTNSQTISINGQILKCDKPAYVGGTLDGRLTIVTTDGNDIVIGDEINYKNNILATSNDILALVSGKDIVVPPKTCNAKTGMNHSFKTKGGTVYGSLFMPFGGIWVEDQCGTFDGLYTGLHNLNIRGGVLLNEAYGTYDIYCGTPKGIKCKAYQDPRFLDNTAIAPGIPFANMEDQERSSGSTEYMAALGGGSWRNTVARN